MSSPRALLLCCLILVSPAPAAGLRYALDYAAPQRRMHVVLCGAEAQSERHFLLDPGAQRAIDAVVRSSGRPLERDGARWSAPDWRADECLRYDADLGAIAARNAEDVGYRVPVMGQPQDQDLVVAAQQWLMDTPHDGAADVHVELPDGYALSAPWTMEGGGYRIAPTPRSWSSNVAIGRFRVVDVPAGKGVVHLALPGIRNGATEAMLTHWVGGVARAALSAYGRLPLDQVQVLVLPLARSDQAVVFGESTRGQGHGLTLFVDARHPEQDFDGEWTSVHEFCHLFHPYLGEEGRWMAEGLATYWQNVLRARAGLLTPGEAWKRLDEGFARGRAATHTGLPLGGPPGTPHERGFGRMYWGGAAYWLAVDVELRRRSGGKIGVDVALSRFRDCCLTPAREWAPEAFAEKLDTLVGMDVFAPRYRAAAAQTDFPDLASLYADLGVVAHAGKAPSFDEKAPQAALRRAIMAPP